jgi:hypothetical protein
VAAQVLEGGVYQALVAGELLQDPGGARGAADGHEIGGLHLLVGEARDGRAHGVVALEAKADVVEDEGEDARWPGRRFRRRRCADPHVLAVGDGLRAAVLQDLEVFCAEAAHHPALAIRHHGVDLHEVDAHADHRWCVRGGKCRRARHEDGDADWREAGHPAKKLAQPRPEAMGGRGLFLVLA